jgi:hypothetical protein
MGCFTKKETNRPMEKFKILNIDLEKNNVANFTRLKRTFLYRDKIISFGLYGGFACLNARNFERDTVLEKQLNANDFSKAGIYQDTLFGEKFKELFYWSSNKWMKYQTPQPIKYFDIVYEDNHHVFYTSSSGEFGTIIFAYDKNARKTYAQLTTEPNSILKTDTGYFVGIHSYHGGFSGIYSIKNVSGMKPVSDTLRHIRTLYDRDFRFSALWDTSAHYLSNYADFRHKGLNENFPEMITASFITNGKLFHIVDPWDVNNRGKRYLCKTEKDSLVIIDTLNNIKPSLAFRYKAGTIINEEEYQDGFTLVRNDTIFRITFKAAHKSQSL